MHKPAPRLAPRPPLPEGLQERIEAFIRVVPAQHHVELGTRGQHFDLVQHVVGRAAAHPVDGGSLDQLRIAPVAVQGAEDLHRWGRALPVARSWPWTEQLRKVSSGLKTRVLLAVRAQAADHCRARQVDLPGGVPTQRQGFLRRVQRFQRGDPAGRPHAQPESDQRAPHCSSRNLSSFSYNSASSMLNIVRNASA